MTSIADLFVAPAVAGKPKSTPRRIGVVGPRLAPRDRLMYERLYARLIEDAALTSRETMFFLDTSQVGRCALRDLVVRHNWPRERLRIVTTEDEILDVVIDNGDVVRNVVVQRFPTRLAVGAAIADMTDELLCFVPGFSMIEAQVAALVAKRLVQQRNAVPTDLDVGLSRLVGHNLEKHYRLLARSRSSPALAAVEDDDVVDVDKLQVSGQAAAAAADDDSSSSSSSSSSATEDNATISSLSSPADADKGNDTETDDEDDGKKDSNLAFGVDTETPRKRKRKPVDRYNPSQKVPRTQGTETKAVDDDDDDDIDQEDSWSESDAEEELLSDDDGGDDNNDDDDNDDEPTLKQVVVARRRASDLLAVSFFPNLYIAFYNDLPPVVTWATLDQRLLERPDRFSGVLAGVPLTIDCLDALSNWPLTRWFRTLCNNAKMVSATGSTHKERTLHVLARLAYCGRVTATSPCGAESEPLQRCDICGLSRAHRAGVKIIIHGPLLDEEAALVAEAGLKAGTSAGTVLKFPLYLWAGSHCGELALRIIYFFSLLCLMRRLVSTAVGEKTHDEIVKQLLDLSLPRRIELAARAVEHVFDKTANPQGFACTPLTIGSNTPTAPFWFGKK